MQMFDLAPDDYTAIFLSLKVGMTATLLSLPFGFLAAYALVFLRFPGKLILEVAVNLPLTMPPVVVGYFLLVVLGKNGIIGSVLDEAGIPVVFTWKAAAIAAAVVGFPLLVRAIRISMEGIDPHLVHASRTLGAHWYDTLLTIIVPLSIRGILAGSSLLFARSLGEFGATIIVAGNIPGVTRTIPLAIYDYASSPGGEKAALALCTFAVLISLFVLLLHEYLRKKNGRNV